MTVALMSENEASWSPGFGLARMGSDADFCDLPCSLAKDEAVQIRGAYRFVACAEADAKTLFIS
jgi:hypothetical protein